MPSIKIESRIWIEKDGIPYLGCGRVKLLEAIDECGSIAKAASTLGMSYKKAWRLVKSMNQLSDTPLMIKEAGGKNGGGTRLTLPGKNIIQEYRKIELKNNSFLKSEAEKCPIR